MIDLKSISDTYFINGYEVPYTLKKGGTISIKPILLKDYNRYMQVKNLLEIKKNELGDINIIKMSYLEFLYTFVSQKEEIKTDLSTLFSLCIGVESIAFGKDKERICLLLLNNDDTIKSVITQQEFNDISKIILNQNEPYYDNRYVNPEVREMMEEYYKIKYKDIASPSLEQKKAFVCSKIGKTFLELNNMTCREFELIYKASVDSEIYIGEKIIQGSYKYQVNKDILHPLFEPQKDPYAEIFESTSVLSNKGINGAEQLNSINL